METSTQSIRTTSTNPNFFELPSFSDELVNLVLSFLPKKEQVTVRLTCKRWNYVLAESPLWRPLFTFFPTLNNSLEKLDSISNTKIPTHRSQQKIISNLEDVEIINFSIEKDYISATFAYGLDGRSLGIAFWKPNQQMECRKREVHCQISEAHKIFPIQTGYLYQSQEDKLMIIEGGQGVSLEIDKETKFYTYENLIIYDITTDQHVSIYNLVTQSSIDILASRIWCFSSLPIPTISTYLPDQKKIITYKLNNGEVCEKIEVTCEAPINSLYIFEKTLIGKGDFFIVWDMDNPEKMMYFPMDDESSKPFVENNCLIIQSSACVNLYSLETGKKIFSFAAPELSEAIQTDMYKHYLFILSKTGCLNIYNCLWGELAYKKSEKIFLDPLTKFQIANKFLYGIYQGKLVEYPLDFL